MRRIEADRFGRPQLCLPDDFWVRRGVFQYIRAAAHARCAPADAVFLMVLARVAAMSPHATRVATHRGFATLNLYVAVIGDSGGGKSAAHGAAADLLRPPSGLDFHDAVPVGSGEGIAEAFMGMEGSPKRKAQVRHNALFYVDEGAALAKLAERSGSTLGETLRRAFGGEALGQTNATADRSRLVLRHTYSMGVIVGFQPDAALHLLSEASLGGPQRFLWALTEDPWISDVAEWPGPLGITTAIGGRSTFMEPSTLSLPPSVREELRRKAVAKTRGFSEGGAALPLEDPLDAHADLVRIKVAGLLCLLDGRRKISEEDWELAETIWKTSCAVRNEVVAHGERQREQARKADHQRAADRKGAEANGEHEAHIQRVARRLIRAVGSADGRLKVTDFRRNAGRDRGYLDEAIEHAVQSRRLHEADDGFLILGAQD
ncbi:DUF3987 domain-containing protein [Streptomyces sp. NPDC048558]|uniref:DUF3987 domain-containing protein n=1 Tax=Streptomyces sp. NPDC048558 TaxID=3155759 RepID=UPI003420267F